MIPFTLGVVGLLVAQAAINAPRQTFMTCLKGAVATATAQKIAADQFSAHAKQTCSAQANSFRDALISFDVKNGIKRAQATDDAQLQVDDYVSMSAEKYAEKAEIMAPKAKTAELPPPTPTPTPAAAAQPQQ